jgi:hypothetical protein
VTLSAESTSFIIGIGKLIFLSSYLFISTLISLLGAFIKTGGLFGAYTINLNLIALSSLLI